MIMYDNEGIWHDAEHEAEIKAAFDSERENEAVERYYERQTYKE